MLEIYNRMDRLDWMVDLFHFWLEEDLISIKRNIYQLDRYISPTMYCRH